MCNRKTLPAKSAQQGVVMVEAMIAILIFSMGVLAIVGLQAAMVKNTADSKYRADASYIAQQRIGQLWADPANLPADGSTTNPDISALLPSGALAITRAGTQFTVTVGWTAPGETPAASAATAPCFMLVAHCYTTITSIAGG